MDLITKVELPVNQCEVEHNEKIMLMGSCFADNIGRKLEENKFDCERNPFGVLYNPMSIHAALTQLLDNKLYSESDLMFSRNLWFSLMHHSSFSSADLEECLNKINKKINDGNERIKTANWLILTFGTARVYTWTPSVALPDNKCSFPIGSVVGNCHKLADKNFTRRLLDVDEIVDSYIALIKRIREINPDLKVMFTVSPIRHSKDGMHGNQVSKSVLILSVEKICTNLPECYYFPSYEIMMDELRDYRYYSDDMLHPSSLAVEYIWNCFSESYFTRETCNIIKEWNEISKALSHKPFNPESDAYRSFLSQILLKIERLKEKFAYLDVENEKKLCQTLLKK